MNVNRKLYQDTRGGICFGIPFSRHISDFPVPYIQFFDDRKYKKSALVNIRQYNVPEEYAPLLGFQKHYYIDIQEECDPIWNSREGKWQVPFDSPEKISGKNFKKKVCPTVQETEEYIDEIIKKHFIKHKVIYSIPYDLERFFKHYGTKN